MQRLQAFKYELMPILMIPGATAFTRIPFRAYSIASDFVAAFSPPFVRD